MDLRRSLALSVLVLLVSGVALSQTNISSDVATATGGTTARTVASKFGDVKALEDFGAVCDGTTDDSAAITAAEATGVRVMVPEGVVCNAPSIAASSLTGVLTGPGRIKTSDGNLTAPIYTGLTTAPSSYGNTGGISTAFNGDLSHVVNARGQIVSGAATIGQPTSGFVSYPENAITFDYTKNLSGYNNSLSGNGGRTGLYQHYAKVDNYGQGDQRSYGCFGFVNSVLSGATNYLANPAVGCLGGNFFAGMSGDYIEFLGDLDIADNGNDIAARGSVLNLTRTNATEAVSSHWIGWQTQSAGTSPIDAFERYSGPATAGIDMSSADLSAYRLGAYTISGAGNGYVVGDILTASGGTHTGGTSTQVSVSSISGSGGVTGLAIINTGIYSTPPNSGFSTISTTGGSGSGFALSGQFVNHVALSMPATGGCIMQPLATGSLYTVRNGTNASICTDLHGVSIGAVGTTDSGASGYGLTLATGPNDTRTGTGTVVIGNGGNDEAQNYTDVFAARGVGGVNGTSQDWRRILVGSTTGGSSIVLTVDQAAPNANNSVLIHAGANYIIDWEASAIDKTTFQVINWVNKHAVAYRSPTGTVAYAGDGSSPLSPDTAYSTGTVAGATIGVVGNTTCNCLYVTFTPPTGSTDSFHANIKITGIEIQ